MNINTDAGVIAALMERFEKQRLPRLLDLTKKVEAAEKLNDIELSFLSELYSDIQQVSPLIERHPEYHALFSQVSDLYKSIASKALDNEK